MAFVAAMSASPQTKTGVNGESVLTEAGVGDLRVSLFTMLVRGLEGSYIRETIDKIALTATPKEWEDLFVMAFQTRDVRGGKGERRLFYEMMNTLAVYKPDIVAKLVPHIPEYGCWRDLWNLYNESVHGVVKTAILCHVKSIFQEDYQKGENISLLAKWLPREKSQTYKGLAKVLANTLFPEIPEKGRMAVYRKHVAFLNRKLKTVEIDMCGNTWSQIEPTHVPGRNLKLHNAAFFNKKLEKQGGKWLATEKTRYPGVKDREECRDHFLKFMDKVRAGKIVAKGADVVMPHEIVRTFLSFNKYAANEQVELLTAQWNAIREAAKEMGSLERVVPMCDFSGSMSGIPLQVSLALGILISEMNSPAFRDHILTFDHVPEWHCLAGKTLYEKVRESVNYGQGLSTDFFKACRMILEKMEAAKVPVGEEPTDLIVLTDMGWDEANMSACRYGQSNKQPAWTSQIERIRNEFAEASRRVWGEDTPGWKVPRIVIWNLRAEYKDFHATAQDEGVLMISGWSPNALHSLQKNGIKTMTPYEGMRAVLDLPRYDLVRRTFQACVQV
jgi:hypothetical protein